MSTHWITLFRPLGIALGIFILLNVALALERPELAATHIWLHLHFSEPALSLFAGVLGSALFVPHSFARRRAVRAALVLIFAVFLSLAVDNTAAYYEDLARGRFESDFPAPFSAAVVILLLIELARVLWWQTNDALTPPPAWLFLRSIHVAVAFFLWILAHVLTYGHVDHRRPADAAVIFGAKVYANGTPCVALVDRLETGIELFAKGFVHHLILSGAVDPNGQSEPQVMKRYAVGRGVPESRIIVDESGVNTRASALSVGAIQSRLGFGRLLAVTQYFHCARVKLIFDREGTSCSTVPTCSTEKDWRPSPARLSREGFFLLREAAAFPFYMIYYR